MYVGLDIGGTKFLVATSSGNGKIINQIQASTPIDFDKGIAQLHQMIEKVTEGQKITSIGVAIGGPLDRQKGVVSPLHQVKWRDVPLKKIMEKRWNCHFSIDVDTNVAALGEYHLNNETAPYWDVTFYQRFNSTLDLKNGLVTYFKIFHQQSIKVDSGYFVNAFVFKWQLNQSRNNRLFLVIPFGSVVIICISYIFYKKRKYHD